MHSFATALRSAFHDLRINEPLRMAGATAFFTTFALPPILIILIRLLGILIDPKTISDHLFDHLSLILGEDGVAQIRETLVGFRGVARNWYIAVGGFIFLLFVATTLFKVIRDSLNQLWNIRVHRHAGVKFSLIGRLKAIAVIMFAGLLFLATLLAEGLQALLIDYVREIYRGSVSFLYFFLNQLLSVIVVSTWFSVLFRFIANAQPAWRVAFAGGLVTGILFTIGKLVLGWLLGYSNIQDIYGASGSFVLVLLFVFYSSFILYYGACFTKTWGEIKGMPVRPGKNSYVYELLEKKME